jgi:hypothetical protein
MTPLALRPGAQICTVASFQMCKLFAFEPARISNNSAIVRALHLKVEVCTSIKCIYIGAADVKVVVRTSSVQKVMALRPCEICLRVGNVFITYAAHSLGNFMDALIKLRKLCARDPTKLVNNSAILRALHSQVGVHIGSAHVKVVFCTSSLI